MFLFRTLTFFVTFTSWKGRGGGGGGRERIEKKRDYNRPI